MKNFGGCSAPMGLAVLALVLGLFGAGYGLMTYIDKEMGSNGVLLFVGILIGVPLLIIVLLIVAAFALGIAKIYAGAAESNDGSMQAMLRTYGQMITLAKQGRSHSEPVAPVDGWAVLPPPEDPLKRLTASPSWDTHTQTQNSNRLIIES